MQAPNDTATKIVVYQSDAFIYKFDRLFWYHHRRILVVLHYVALPLFGIQYLLSHQLFWRLLFFCTSMYYLEHFSHQARYRDYHFLDHEAWRQILQEMQPDYAAAMPLTSEINITTLIQELTLANEELSISFRDESRNVDRFKAKLERFTGCALDWWPLAPPLQQLMKKHAQLRWDCGCGDQRYVQVDAGFATQLLFAASSKSRKRQMSVMAFRAWQKGFNEDIWGLFIFLRTPWLKLKQRVTGAQSTGSGSMSLPAYPAGPPAPSANMSSSTSGAGQNSGNTSQAGSGTSSQNTVNAGA